MSDPEITTVAGLQLSNNTFSASPPGSMSKATNGVISQKGVFKPRNGQERLAVLPLAADLPFSLFEFQQHIIANYALSKTGNYGLGYVNGGTLTAYSGTYNPTGRDGVATDYARMHFALSSLFLYFCTANSPACLETYNGTPRAAGLPRMPDLRTNQVAKSRQLLAPGIIPYNSNVAYASVVRRPTSTGSLLLGPPSNHAVITNRIFMVAGTMVRTGGALVTVTPVPGAEFNVRLIAGDTFTLTPGEANFPAGSYVVAAVTPSTFTFASVGANVANTVDQDADTGSVAATPRIKLPPGVVAGDKARLYRSVATSSSAIQPPRDLYLAAEVTISAGNVTAGFVDVNDTTPQSVLQDPLYTNPSDGDGQGELGANFKPPVYVDLANWDSRVFYLNTTGQQYLDLQMLGVGATDGVQDGDTITVITNGNTYVFTFKNVPVGANDIKIVSDGTPSYNIASTTENMIRLLARATSSPLVDGVLTTGSTSPNGFPGSFRMERLDFGAAFSVKASRPATWTPALDPTTATSSFPDTRPNGLVWGKAGQPEAVPVLNKTSVGAANYFGRRIFGLRNSLIILKEGDGIWSLTGTAGNYSLLQISLANIIAPDCACVFSDSVWAYTDQGILRISDTGGVQVVSRPIETLLNDLAARYPEETYSYAFAVPYETERRVMFFLPVSQASSTYGGAPLIEAYAYSTATNAWTGPLIFDGTAISGVVRTSHKLALGLFDATFATGRITSERKTGTYLDIADADWANTLTVTSDPLVIQLATAGALQAGSGVGQGQWLTKISAVLGGGLYQVEETIPWVNGACTTYDPFLIEVQFLPEGTPGARKALQRLLSLYQPDSFQNSFGLTTLFTDQMQDLLEISTPKVGYGLNPYGTTPYGDPAPMVVDVNPIEAKWATAGQFFPGFKLNEVWPKFRLQGVGMRIEGASAPVGRSK